MARSIWPSSLLQVSESALEATFLTRSALRRTPPGPLSSELAVGSSKRFRRAGAPWGRCRNPD
jgi:hypothetical protein